ncbi:hypothetical protein ACIHQR_10240 [Corallococcus coralloides]
MKATLDDIPDFFDAARTAGRVVREGRRGLKRGILPRASSHPAKEQSQ